MYTYNGKSIVCQTSCPCLLDFDPFCDKFPVVGALVSGRQLSLIIPVVEIQYNFLYTVNMDIFVSKTVYGIDHERFIHIF